MRLEKFLPISSWLLPFRPCDPRWLQVAARLPSLRVPASMGERQPVLAPEIQREAPCVDGAMMPGA